MRIVPLSERNRIADKQYIGKCIDSTFRVNSLNDHLTFDDSSILDSYIMSEEKSQRANSQRRHDLNMYNVLQNMAKVTLFEKSIFYFYDVLINLIKIL